MADETTNDKLDVLIRLFALQVGGELSVAERAPLLRRAGLSSSMIAEVCNTTANAVNARLGEAEKRGKRKSVKKKTRGTPKRSRRVR